MKGKINKEECQQSLNTAAPNQLTPSQAVMKVSFPLFDFKFEVTQDQIESYAPV
jgi:hypothetical protein